MPITFDTLATTTLTSPQNTVTFSGISQSYRYLRLVLATQAANTGTGWAQKMQFNGSTSSIYYGADYYRYSTSALTAGQAYTSNGCFLGYQGNQTTNIQATTIVDIFDYSSTSLYKQITYLNAACDTTSGNDMASWGGSSQWRSLSAITSITFMDQAGNIFNTGSVFSLYGIVSA